MNVSTMKLTPTCQSKFEERGYLQIIMEGDWLMEEAPPSWDTFKQEMKEKNIDAIKTIGFDISNIGIWDSALLIFLTQCKSFAHQKKIQFRIEDLPQGIGKILKLATTSQQESNISSLSKKSSFVEKIGQLSLNFLDEAKDHIFFIGEIALSVKKLFQGKSMMRGRDLLLLIEETGAQALPIVSLIAFLIGVIMAFVGSVQLKQFGADIYVADLVGLAMTREMGAVMAAVILTGRTGASYAASIGTMKVTEEIDALKTLGVPPIDFLVLPRILALFFMMPLLCIYADFVGMFGGYFVSMCVLDISSSQYINQTREAVTITHFSVGIIKSFIFGIIVAVIGCLRGMKCGSNSSAVGDAATQAVVYGITYIVVADAIFTFIFNILNV